MPAITLVKEPPKGLQWKVEVDGRNYETEEEIFDILRNISRGDVNYFKTNFQDERRRITHAPLRKKHFKDGYWMYTFWFTKKRDAALFRLMTWK